MTKWTHKVVKRARGGDGQMFDFPTAGTFCSEAEAREYAKSFAIEQSGVLGAQYTVRSRKGSCSTGAGAVVAIYLPGGIERPIAG